MSSHPEGHHQTAPPHDHRHPAHHQDHYYDREAGVEAVAEPTSGPKQAQHAQHVAEGHHHHHHSHGKGDGSSGGGGGDAAPGSESRAEAESISVDTSSGGVGPAVERIIRSPRGNELQRLSPVHAKKVAHIPDSPVDGCLSPITVAVHGRHAKRPRDIVAMSDGASSVPPAPPAYPQIILGTSSEPRQAVMKETHLPYTVMKADIDEDAVKCDDLMQLPIVIAKAKAAALVPRVPNSAVALVTADQVVLVGDEARSKPATAEDAYRYLKDLCGATVRTIGNIAADVMDKLVDGGHGVVMWCAGAVCVEHPLMQPYIESMDPADRLDSVFGLPKDVLLELLGKCGIRVPAAVA